MSTLVVSIAWHRLKNCCSRSGFTTKERRYRQHLHQTKQLAPPATVLQRAHTHLLLTLPSLKAWGFSLLRENLESTELNPDTFPDLKPLSELSSG